MKALKRHLGRDPSCLQSLASISTALGEEVSVRQLASKLLRKAVQNSQFDQQPGRSYMLRMSIETKQELVAILLRSLERSDAKIRDSNAHVVAAIIKQDWRTMWEQTFTDLTTKMNTNDSNTILGSLKVVAAVFDGSLYVKGFLKRYIYTKEFLQCSSSFLLTIGQLIHSLQTTDNCRVHAIGCLSSYIKQLVHVGDLIFVGEVRFSFK